MSQNALTPTPEKPKREPRRTATVERHLPDLHIHLKLLLEPLDGEKVRIVEYRRRRDNEQRYTRVKEQEGEVYPYAQLNLDQPFEELFPRTEPFTATDQGTPS